MKQEKDIYASGEVSAELPDGGGEQPSAGWAVFTTEFEVEWPEDRSLLSSYLDARPTANGAIGPVAGRWARPEQSWPTVPGGEDGPRRLVSIELFERQGHLFVSAKYAVPTQDRTSELEASAQAEAPQAEAPQAEAPQAEALQAETSAGGRRIPGLGAVARGFGWNSLVQLTNVGGNLALTPFIIHGLGVERYGLYMLALTVTGLFSGLDGGVTGTAGRFFAMYAGADDRRQTTRLLVTLLALLCGLGVLLSAATWFAAPPVANLLSMAPSFRPQAVFLLRTFGVLALTGFLHNLFQQVINARQRYAWTSQASLAVYVLYIVGFVVVIRSGAGLTGVALIFVGQQVLASVMIVPAALRYLDRHALGLLSWAELRHVLSFSSKVQLGNVVALVNSSVDPLVIGGGLSARAMGYYSPGANFAFQLFALATNVLQPAGVYLGNVFGRHGEEATFKEFVRLQKLWVAAVTGWCSVAMASAYFGIVVWLGPRFHLTGWICVVLTAGNGALLVALLVSSFATVVGKPGLVARYGLVGTALNLGLTVPLVLLGSLGVVAATAAGEIVTAGYLLHKARHQVRSDLPNPLRDVPVLPGVAVAALTVALEFALRPHVPSGPLGLLAMGVPAAFGLLVFAVLTAGPRRVAGYAAHPARALGVMRARVTGELFGAA